MRKCYLFTALLILMVAMCDAQYSVLLDFNGTNGSGPYGSLILAGNKLYGMTYSGGANGDGCVFAMDTTGAGYKDLLDFNGTNGANPYYGKLTLSGSMLFGMTSKGGANADGCVFSIDTNGSGYKDVLDFKGSNGASPYGSVTLVGKLLYGLTSAGGANGDGCIFSVDTNGAGYRDIHDFAGTDGQNPTGGLTILRNTLFGMAEYGGANGNGCVFSIDTNGSGYRDMLDFGDQNPPYGANPTGSLVISGGMMFGLTSAGGVSDFGCAFSMDTNGAGYKDLVDFNSGSKGYFPFGDITLAGNVLYGMANSGAANSKGCIFSVDSNGSNFSVIYSFASATGGNPYGNLTRSGSGFYGLVESGGTNANGVVFKYNYSALGITSVTDNPNEVQLFPNPNNGAFTIEIKNTKQNMKNTIEIYNALGEKIYSTDNNKPAMKNSLLTINLTDKPAGIYIYRVVNQNGAIVANGKFMVR